MNHDNLNSAAVNLLHEKSEERFVVRYLSSYGFEKTWGPDSAAGILAFLYDDDVILSIERAV